MQPATPSSLETFRFPVPWILFCAALLAICAWVLSLPVFPSQDGPLHLYYINVLRQLLLHRPGLYPDTYFIRSYLPPYATYYYGLIALGALCRLETADKLFACISILLFAFGTRALMRTSGVRSEWAPLLILPFLVNWPLMMGFASYSLAVGLACFALAAWCRNVHSPSTGRRAWFLALVGAVVLTHPIPWLVVVAFIFFELILRWLLRAQRPANREGSTWGADALTASLACAPALYVAHYRARKTQVLDYVDAHTGQLVPIIHPGLRERIHLQLLELRHIQGLVVFDGAGLSRLYRLGLQALLVGALLLAVGHVVQRRTQRGPDDYMSRVWLLFSLALAASLLLVPNDLGGGYFFSTRLEIVLATCCVTAAAFGFQGGAPVRVALASFAFLLSLGVVLLGFRFITPVAREVASLRNIPEVAAGAKPGMVMRPPGSAYPNHLTFYSYYWAPVHYLRVHNLLLFNTAWLGDPIIPVYPKADQVKALDGTFYNESPQFPSRLLLNEEAARGILDRVDFVVFAQASRRRYGSPFATVPGAPNAAPFAAAWTCVHDPQNIWDLCSPPPGSVR